MEYITFEYSTEDPQALLGSVSWEAGGINGSGISGYTLGDEEVVFDTVVGFANHRMVSGDTVETTTNGATLLLQCSVWNLVKTIGRQMIGSAYIFLTVDLADHSFPFVGDYWMANGWGASIFNVPTGAWGASDDWILIGAEWDVSEYRASQEGFTVLYLSVLAASAPKSLPSETNRAGCAQNTILGNAL